MFKGLAFFLILLCISCSNLNDSKIETHVYSTMPGYVKLNKRVKSINWDEFRDKANNGELLGKVIFHPGDYIVSETTYLRGQNTLHLLAMDGALFLGEFDYMNSDFTLPVFSLYRGNITFSNFNFTNVGTCIAVAKNVVSRNVTINDLVAKDVNRCIAINPNGNRIIKYWLLNNINIIGYYKYAIRLSGKNTSHVTINNTYIDGSHQFKNNSCYKGGIQIYQGAHHIHINNVHIKNNYGDCAEKYQQGDGIEIDHKNGRTRDITLKHIKIENSGDANFDIKADNVVMENIVSIAGIRTRFAYKFWGYPNYRCTDCSSIGNFSTHINLNSASVIFKNYYYRGTSDTAMIKCKRLKGFASSSIHILRGLDKNINNSSLKFSSECSRTMK